MSFRDELKSLPDDRPKGPFSYRQVPIDKSIYSAVANEIIKLLKSGLEANVKRRYYAKDNSFFKGEHNFRYEALITIALHSVAFQPEYETSLYYGMRDYYFGYYGHEVYFTVQSPYFEDFKYVLEELLEKHDFDGIYWRDNDENNFLDHPKFKSYTKNKTEPIDAIIDYMRYDSKMNYPGKMIDITAWIDCNPDGSIT